MYRVYACGYEKAATWEEATKIASKYEMLGRAPHIEEEIAEGARRIVSNGEQAIRVIALYGKDEFRRIGNLQWWLRIYTSLGVEHFAADIAIMIAQIEVWKLEK